MTTPILAARHGNDRAMLALALAFVGAASMLYYHLGLLIPRALEARAAQGLGNGYAFGNDFYPIWLTSRQALMEQHDAYGAAMTRKIQIGLFGRPLSANNPQDPPIDYRTFAYPAYADLIFWPLATVPFATLRVLLAPLLVSLTVVSILFWSGAVGWRGSLIQIIFAIILTLCSYPVLEGMFAEQPGLILGFFFAVAMFALHRGRLLLAGILMALTTIKPQMTALAILYLLLWSLCDWRRRGRFAITFLSTMGTLIAASLLVWPHWISAWVHVILGYHRYATPPLISELLGRSSVGPWLIVAFLIMAAILGWRNRPAEADSLDFWMTLSMLLAISAVAIMPGLAVYDHVVLLPGIFLLVSRWREFDAAGPVFRMLRTAGVIVILWPWLAAFALVVMSQFLSPERLYSTTLFAMPLRTAASLPFIVLALLALMWRRRMQLEKRQAE
jgi:Glycosyltransferase family 87